jgi:fatty-acyl-CoA synthase
VIVPKGVTPTREALSAWVRESLRSTKTPETWDFRAELPYNETGKLLRRVLKQELSQAAKTPAGA